MADLDLALASAEEEEAIASIRKVLEPELAKLAADGLDWSHTTGDIFMVRLLRGNNSSVDEAVDWFRKMVSLRAEHGFDDIHRRCEAENIRWAAAAMPHSQENLRYMTTAFDEVNLISPDGHLFYYDGLGDLKTSELIQNVGIERWLEFLKFGSERRTSVLDRMSHEQGRLVKIVRVIDFEGASVSSVREYFQLVRQHLADSMKGTAIEVMQRCYIINFPQWALVFYKIGQKILPPRMLKRIRILGREFLQDEEFAKDVGAELIAKVRANRKTPSASDDGAYEGARRIIPAGQSLERLVEVAPGILATWDFSVGSAAEGGASSRGLLGRALDATRGEDSSVAFSAAFLPSSDGDAAPAAEPVEPVRIVSPVDGAQSGSMLADRSGVLLLCWSNKESYVRAKMLSSFKIATNGDGSESAAQVEAAAADKSS